MIRMQPTVIYLLKRKPLRMNEDGACQAYATSSGKVRIWSYSISTAEKTVWKMG